MIPAKLLFIGGMATFLLALLACELAERIARMPRVARLLDTLTIAFWYLPRMAAEAGYWYVRGEMAWRKRARQERRNAAARAWRGYEQRSQL